MSEKHFLYLRGQLSALEAEAFTLTGIAMLWGWKAVGWALLTLAALNWLSAVALALQWNKRGYDADEEVIAVR